jgi:hypothetical protein
VAPLTVAPFPLADDAYAWRPAMPIVGIAATALLLPAALLTRRPPVVLPSVWPAAPVCANFRMLRHEGEHRTMPLRLNKKKSGHSRFEPEGARRIWIGQS